MPLIGRRDLLRLIATNRPPLALTIKACFTFRLALPFPKYADPKLRLAALRETERQDARGHGRLAS